ncbi:hypothetical protein SAMN05421778_1521, partial [Sphaerotilus natans]
LVGQLLRTLSGRLSDDELVLVQESEDLAQLEAAHKDAAAARH